MVVLRPSGEELALQAADHTRRAEGSAASSTLYQ
jgi:hypothetical protein